MAHGWLPGLSSVFRKFDHMPVPAPLTADPLALLRQYWGHQQFRPGQQEIIEAVLAGRDALALLPTGGG